MTIALTTKGIMKVEEGLEKKTLHFCICVCSKYCQHSQLRYPEGNLSNGFGFLGDLKMWIPLYENGHWHHGLDQPMGGANRERKEEQ